jgi:hypothetical protein
MTFFLASEANDIRVLYLALFTFIIVVGVSSLSFFSIISLFLETSLLFVFLLSAIPPDSLKLFHELIACYNVTVLFC